MQSVPLPNTGKVFSPVRTVGRLQQNQTYLQSFPLQSERGFIKPEAVLSCVIYWESAATEQWKRAAGNSKPSRPEGSGDIQISLLILLSHFSGKTLDLSCLLKTATDTIFSSSKYFTLFDYSWSFRNFS